MIRYIVGCILLCTPVCSLTLQDAEDLALANNPQVKAATELLEKAKQGRLESVSRWLPQLSLLTQAFRSQEPLTFLKLNQPSAFFTQISLTQALIVSDLIYDLRISRFMEKQAQQILEAARNDVLFAVRAGYFRVALDKSRLATAREHVELLQNLAQKIQGLNTIGEATAYQVNQAKVAVSNVTEAYYRALRDLKTHQDEIVRILGQDPSENIAVDIAAGIDVLQLPDIARKVTEGEKIFKSSEGYAPIFYDSFTQMQNTAMLKMFSEQELGVWAAVADQQRPDIQLSKTIIAIAQQKVGNSQMQYLPKLSIQGGYGGGSTPYLELPSTRFNNQEMQWAFGLSLSWLLFDGLGRERKIRMAKAEQRAAVYDAEKVLQKAHAEVRSQIYEMESALSQYLTAEANLKLAQQTLQQAISSVEIGYVTIYDYLISADGLIRAKTAFDEGKYSLITAYYGLLHACGRRE